MRGITLGGSWIALFALAALAIALSIVVYRYTLPPVARLRRTILWTIRSLALVLILFLLFEPVLSWLDRRDEAAKILLLVDRSASMSQKDAAGDRNQIALDFLNRAEWKSFEREDALRVFTFSDTVRETTLDSVASTPADQVGSNQAQAWTRALDVSAGEYIGAVVLLSDGSQNMGPNPERLASEAGVPIYTVAVGDSTVRRDLLISELLTNQIAYAGSKIPVVIRVRANGAAGSESSLRLVDSRGRTWGQERITFNSNVVESSFEFIVDALEEGEFRLTAFLDSIPAEAVAENNRRSVIVRVLDSKFQVVVLAGAPSPDLTALLQLLGQDTTMVITPFVQSSSGRFTGNRVPDEAALNRAELFVFQNFPTNSPDPAFSIASARIREKRIPLLFLDGPNVSVERLSSISDIVPLDFSARARAVPVVARAGQAHPSISGAAPLPVTWEELPPVSGYPQKITAKSGSVVIATFADEASPEVAAGPAITVWEMSRRRGAVISVHDYYRWKLGVARSDMNREFLDTFVNRLTTWLLTPTEEKPVQITTDRKLYSGGQPARFQAQVYGANLIPQDNASVMLRVNSGDRSEIVALRGRGNGLYEGEFNPWSDGDFTYEGVAVLQNDTLGKDDGSFSVEAFNIEWVDPRARFDVMSQVAERSGGIAVTAANPSALFDKLSFKARTSESRSEIPLWNRPLILWIIIALLAAEWLLRKRSGML